MTEFALSVLADQAIVSRDGKLSIIGIFRNVRLRQVPMRYPKFTVAAIMRQVDRPIKVSIEVLDLKENEVLAKLPAANFKPPRVGEDLQLLVDMVDLPFKTFGRHEVRITVDGEVAKFIPFTVSQAVQPALKRMA
jgi:hypothetical protein